MLNCDRSSVKHALQNTQNDCYQWLSNSSIECTKFDFSRGSAPDPARGAYSAPRYPSWFKGPTSKGRERNGREKRGEGGEKVGEGQGTGEWKGRGRDAKERGGEGMKKERRGRERREEK